MLSLEELKSEKNLGKQLIVDPENAQASMESLAQNGPSHPNFDLLPKERFNPDRISFGELEDYLRFVGNLYGEEGSLAGKAHGLVMSMRNIRENALFFLHEQNYSLTKAKFFLIFPSLLVFNGASPHQKIELTEEEMEEQIKSYYRELADSKSTQQEKWLKETQDSIQRGIGLSKLVSLLEYGKSMKYEVPDWAREIYMRASRLSKDIKSTLDGKHERESLLEVERRTEDMTVLPENIGNLRHVLAAQVAFHEKNDAMLADCQTRKRFPTVKELNDLADMAKSLSSSVKDPDFEKVREQANQAQRLAERLQVAIKGAKTRGTGEKLGLLDARRLLEEAEEIQVDFEAKGKLEEQVERCSVINTTIQSLIGKESILREELERNLREVDDLPLRLPARDELDKFRVWLRRYDEVFADFEHGVPAKDLLEKVEELKQFNFSSENFNALERRVKGHANWISKAEEILRERTKPNLEELIASEEPSALLSLTTPDSIQALIEEGMAINAPEPLLTSLKALLDNSQGLLSQIVATSEPSPEKLALLIETGVSDTDPVLWALQCLSQSKKAKETIQKFLSELENSTDQKYMICLEDFQDALEEGKKYDSMLSLVEKGEKLIERARKWNEKAQEILESGLIFKGNPIINQTKNNSNEQMMIEPNPNEPGRTTEVESPNEMVEEESDGMISEIQKLMRSSASLPIDQRLWDRLVQEVEKKKWLDKKDETLSQINSISEYQKAIESINQLKYKEMTLDLLSLNEQHFQSASFFYEKWDRNLIAMAKVLMEQLAMGSIELRPKGITSKEINKIWEEGRASNIPEEDISDIELLRSNLSKWIELKKTLKKKGMGKLPKVIQVIFDGMSFGLAIAEFREMFELLKQQSGFFEKIQGFKDCERQMTFEELACVYEEIKEENVYHPKAIQWEKRYQFASEWLNVVRKILSGIPSAQFQEGDAQSISELKKRLSETNLDEDWRAKFTMKPEPMLILARKKIPSHKLKFAKNEGESPMQSFSKRERKPNVLLNSGEYSVFQTKDSEKKLFSSFSLSPQSTNQDASEKEQSGAKIKKTKLSKKKLKILSPKHQQAFSEANCSLLKKTAIGKVKRPTKLFRSPSFLQKEVESGENEQLFEKELVEYCICRSTNGDTPMAECELCGVWFHFSCIRLKNSDISNEVSFYCAVCQLRLAQHFKPLNDELPASEVFVMKREMGDLKKLVFYGERLRIDCKETKELKEHVQKCEAWIKRAKEMIEAGFGVDTLDFLVEHPSQRLGDYRMKDSFEFEKTKDVKVHNLLLEYIGLAVDASDSFKNLLRFLQVRDFVHELHFVRSQKEKASYCNNFLKRDVSYLGLSHSHPLIERFRVTGMDVERSKKLRKGIKEALSGKMTLKEFEHLKASLNSNGTPIPSKIQRLIEAESRSRLLIESLQDAPAKPLTLDEISRFIASLKEQPFRSDAENLLVRREIKAKNLIESIHGLRLPEEFEKGIELLVKNEEIKVIHEALDDLREKLSKIKESGSKEN